MGSAIFVAKKTWCNRDNMIKKIFSGKLGAVLSAIGLLGLVFFGTAGCQSINGSTDNDLASVNVVNVPMTAVQAAVTNVFLAHAFAGGPSGTNQFTFRRPAGKMDRLAYGSSMFDQPVIVRVVVATRQQTPTVIVVGCNAAVVVAENDSVFQEVHPVGMFGKSTYEDLLKEVKLQLRQ